MNINLRRDKTVSNANGINVDAEAQVHDFIARIQPTKENLESTVQALQNLIGQLISEAERSKRVELLQTSFEQIMSIYENQSTPDQKARVLLEQAHKYEQLGAWDLALNMLQNVLDATTDAALFSLRVEALRWMGHIYVMQNKWDEAKARYEDSLNLSLEHKDSEGEAHARNALGYFFFETGHFDQASDEWQNALALAEKIQEPKMVASFYTNLGVLANVQGEWEKALAYYSESVPRFEQIGQRRNLAETYHNMAMTYADVDRWAEAGSYYEKSYQIAKDEGDIRLQALVKLNRIKLYLAINDLVLAKALCQHALRSFTRLEDHLGQADAYKYFGMIYTRAQKWDLAASYFEKSITINKEYEHPLGEAETHVEYGKMFKAQDDTASARKEYEIAEDIYASLGLQKELSKVQQKIEEL